MAEVSAANSIRDILNGIQIDNGQRLIGMALGDQQTPEGFATDSLVSLALIATIPVAGLLVVQARCAAAVGRLANRAITSGGLNKFGTCVETALVTKTEL